MKHLKIFELFEDRYLTSEDTELQLLEDYYLDTLDMGFVCDESCQAWSEYNYKYKSFRVIYQSKKVYTESDEKELDSDITKIYNNLKQTCSKIKYKCDSFLFSIKTSLKDEYGTKSTTQISGVSDIEGFRTLTPSFMEKNDPKFKKHDEYDDNYYSGNLNDNDYTIYILIHVDNYVD